MGAAAEPGPPDAEAARLATVLCVIPTPALLILGHQGSLAFTDARSLSEGLLKSRDVTRGSFRRCFSTVLKLRSQRRCKSALRPSVSHSPGLRRGLWRANHTMHCCRVLLVTKGPSPRSPRSRSREKSRRRAPRGAPRAPRSPRTPSRTPWARRSWRPRSSCSGSAIPRKRETRPGPMASEDFSGLLPHGAPPQEQAGMKMILQLASTGMFWGLGVACIPASLRRRSACAKDIEDKGQLTIEVS